MSSCTCTAAPSVALHPLLPLPSCVYGCLPPSRTAAVFTAIAQLCTLSTAGSSDMREAAKGVAAFDYVIVDEAANALEPATLIPLSLLKPSV